MTAQSNERITGILIDPREDDDFYDRQLSERIRTVLNVLLKIPSTWFTKDFAEDVYHLTEYFVGTELDVEGAEEITRLWGKLADECKPWRKNRAYFKGTGEVRDDRVIVAELIAVCQGFWVDVVLNRGDVSSTSESDSDPSSDTENTGGEEDGATSGGKRKRKESPPTKRNAKKARRSSRKLIITGLKFDDEDDDEVEETKADLESSEEEEGDDDAPEMDESEKNGAREGVEEYSEVESEDETMDESEDETVME